MFAHVSTGKVEGDIVMSKSIASIIEGGVIETNSRGAINDRYYLWANGVVPYVIDSTFGKILLSFLLRCLVRHGYVLPASYVSIDPFTTMFLCSN